MPPRESIFLSALRAFVVTIFAMGGVTIGLILLIVGLAFVSEETTFETTKHYTFKILPDAEGHTKLLADSAPIILQIDIGGVIGTDKLTTNSIRSLLTESRMDPLNDRVKGILLHINSGGGIVDDAQGIYTALKEYKEEHHIPIYVYTEGLCASGAVLISAAADKIIANPITLVGSVGVIMPSFLNFSQLMDKIGVQSLTISEGKGKDDLNPLRPWKPDEASNYQQISQFYYQYFVDTLTKQRPSINKQLLVSEYGAHVFPAPEAKEKGFIDAMSNQPKEALKELAEAAGISQEYQVLHAEGKSWVTSLFESKAALVPSEIVHQISLPGDIDLALSGKFLYLYSPGLSIISGS